MLLLLLVLIGGGDAIARFYLLNRQSPELKTEITDDNLRLVNANLTVKFMIHGWGESADKDWYTALTDAYLLRYDCNVIQVDWRKEAAQLYTISAENTRIIGESVGEFIVKLNKYLGLGLEKVHVVGHSLGGQVSGFTGKAVQRLIGKKIDRISGLDPAGPEFEGMNAKDRLAVGDANFVDVTHTDGGIFGFRDPIGTVDFMPNGGVRPQPGCTITSYDNQLSLTQILFCSHIHSYLFFIESINDDNQIAYKCDTYRNYENGYCTMNEQTIYGEDVDRNAVGTFFFKTTPEAPYFT
ncbi:PREDICTED: pancreatic lipase-related protein 2-like [Nicrophorus vespilloides]|uniref:Pancreatic lipase-related protein 2-like n=1 Tax=Nicrophorus vespilloides TaxID=110193 RepID=A0ABM1MUG6_NICVS|nr:PREDICTED: pancreatic lipase-related protein 2-like [Nicrophorus vespilloides]